MNYCTNCGNQIPAGSKFCTSCGTAVTGGNQGYNNMNYQQQPVQQNSTNGFAIAGLICSLLVGSITGIIFLLEQTGDIQGYCFDLVALDFDYYDRNRLDKRHI